MNDLDMKKLCAVAEWTRLHADVRERKCDR
jgi:hypothetical protein